MLVAIMPTIAFSVAPMTLRRATLFYAFLYFYSKGWSRLALVDPRGILFRRLVKSKLQLLHPRP